MKGIRLGDYNQLKVVKKVDFGLYLDGGDEGEILLPSRYVPEGSKVGDELTVFIYLDQEERPVATTEHPLAKVGDFAYLRVAWVNEYGAFLDWGLMKDIFCPFKEQKMRMVKDNYYIVYIKLDEESYRIYLGYALDKNSLGDADVIFDAYSDAVTINVSYSNPLDEALVPQVISFFNRVNSTLYVGKLMVIKSDNVWYAAYEIFLSVDPENITDWDRNNVLAYTALALDTMEEMVDYITEIANGESADNVFAMWQADIGAV